MATLPVTFPSVDCLSIFPSAVKIKSDFLIIFSSPTIFANIENPDTKEALKKPYIPPAVPPAAPPPFIFVIERINCFSNTFENCVRLFSNIFMSVLLAPFWGPYIVDEPKFPRRGLFTSQATFHFILLGI